MSDAVINAQLRTLAIALARTLAATCRDCGADVLGALREELS